MSAEELLKAIAALQSKSAELPRESLQDKIFLAYQEKILNELAPILKQGGHSQQVTNLTNFLKKKLGFD